MKVNVIEDVVRDGNDSVNASVHAIDDSVNANDVSDKVAMDILPDNRFGSLADCIRVITDGVSAPLVETEEFVSRSLQAIQETLPTQQYANGESNVRAVEKSSAHVHSRKMLLAFLRTDRFDVKATAQRCVNYYGLIGQVCGTELLERAFDSPI
mmetsp:Transcript_9214/g.17591  ORF Transcript_9214/g.17591 Transcript_9214/m.17591 type:complete len:154 (-) Transcript_9214:1467-1928(-)